ncbi:MAG: glycerophosphodiester phosphodiesterase family protein [Gammaproteobacteria bacterium]|jgi:glycerophosphoryl diester phosphodiesterase
MRDTCVNDDPATHLVAHRGDARRFPENTLASLEGAIQAGARYLEFDIQMSADGVPMVIHDGGLERTAGCKGSVMARTRAELARIDVGEPARFGNRFAGTPIPTLAEVVALVDRHPGVTAFAEIKSESLEAFGHVPTLEAIMHVLLPVIEACIPISFDVRAVLMARELGARRIGWASRNWADDCARAHAEIGPDFIFRNVDRLAPAETLPDAPWEWVLYEVVDVARARALLKRGAHLIETMAISDMLAAWPTTTGNGIHD